MSRGKELGARLAAWLATPAGLRTARRLQAAGGLDGFRAGGSDRAPSEAPAPGRRPPEPIAVWQPAEDERGRLFVRPDPHPLGDHYATRKILKKKEAELPLRVAFFGESVAAGYLYAPHVTPALVLEDQLRAAWGGEGNFEVIDLARTNETLPSLAATVRASLQIQPDMLVLFTGNNWNLLETPEVSPYAPSVRARQRYAEALGARGSKGRSGSLEEELRKVAEGTFELIALIARTVGIPVIVVVPEVNLVDKGRGSPWSGYPATAWPPGMPATVGMARTARGEPAAAAAAAGGLLALDGGACPTTWRLRGRARAALGAAAEARADLQAEVDGARYATMAFLSAPQATTAPRELLRELAPKHGFACVDLREDLRPPPRRGVPERRLFLDYCHLTREGIQGAMAAAAAEAIRLSGMAAADEEWPSLLGAPAGPRRRPRGRSRRPARRRHPLRPPPARGLRQGADPGALAGRGAGRLARGRGGAARPAGGALRSLSGGPDAGATAQPRLPLPADPPAWLALGPPRRRPPHGGGRGPRAPRHAGAGVATRRLLSHHAPRPEGTDLADPFYLWEPLERFFPDVMDLRRPRAPGDLPRPMAGVTFCLVAGAGQDVELELTARRPGPAAPAAVSVNGRPAGALPVGETWTRGTVRLPAASLRPGLNRLDVAWPPPPAADADPFRSACERLELGLAADLHPVFAEVWSLLARPAEASEQPGVAELQEHRAVGLGEVDRVDPQVAVGVAHQEHRLRVEAVGEEELGQQVLGLRSTGTV